MKKRCESTRLFDCFANIPMMAKLFLLLFIAGILPTLGLAVYSYTQTNRILMQNTYDGIAMYHQQKKADLDILLESYQQVSSLIYTDTRLRDYIIAEYKTDYDFVAAYRYIDSLFYSMMAANSGIHNITIFIQNESMPEDGKFIRHLAATGNGNADWLYHNEASHGNIIYRETYQNKKGAPVFALGRALNYNNYSFPYGYLVIEIKESILNSNIVSDWRQPQIYIVNKDGEVITSGDPISVETQDIWKNAFFTNGPPRDSTDFKRIDDYVYACTPISNGWYILETIIVRDIVRESRNTTWRIVLISGICFTITILLVSAISRYFSSRINFLNRQIKMIEQNKLRHQEDLPGMDELGQLSAAINRMARKLDMAINEAYQKEIQQKRTQLTLLQSQINPHFLYNTLSGISTLALRNGDHEVGRQLNHLSQFYKASLNQGREHITIGEETILTKHYLALQDMRFPGQFRVSWDVDPSLTEMMTLKLLLQPFVENIIHHARREDGSIVNIGISIQSNGQCVQFHVSDDGIGISRERLHFIMVEGTSAGYGVWNVDARIKLAYGDQYGVSIASEEGRGTDVTVRIPLCRKALLP